MTVFAGRKTGPGLMRPQEKQRHSTTTLRRGIDGEFHIPAGFRHLHLPYAPAFTIALSSVEVSARL